VLSLPEILKAAGYHTVAYPDHPYFYNSHLDVSLIRGFEQFNVVSDYERYTSSTNVATPEGRIIQEPRLRAASRELTLRQLREWLGGGGGGKEAGEERADWDPVNEVALARLPPLFERSSYFVERYGREFDAHVFGGPRPRDRPFFLFVNLHMATVALPDPVLYARWVTETLRLNARRRRRHLDAPGPGQDFDAWLASSATALRLKHAPFPSPALYLKHVFDNRFYDATFEAVFRHLETRGLARNTVTVVTSDHGMSLSEHGESLYVHAGARPHEDLIRVPLVVRYPGGSPEALLHGRYEEPVSLLDLFPTFVELGLGGGVFERAVPVRGQNLATRLRERRFEPYLLAESAMGPNSYPVAPHTMAYGKAVIAQGMKLIHAPAVFRTPPGGAGWPITVRLGEGWPFPSPPPPLERVSEPLDLLFDLASDPHERRNLAPERPEEVARLKALVRSWSCESLPWGPVAPVWQGEARATLRALGYIQ
jgi:hypothetical protein